MVKIAADKMQQVFDIWEKMDKSLIKQKDMVTEIASGCNQKENRSCRKHLNEIAGELLENRRAIYELILGMERIKRLYQEQEARLLEKLEGGTRREVRTKTLVDVEFSNEMLELIHRIKV